MIFSISLVKLIACKWQSWSSHHYSAWSPSTFMCTPLFFYWILRRKAFIPVFTKVKNNPLYDSDLLKIPWGLPWSMLNPSTKFHKNWASVFVCFSIILLTNRIENITSSLLKVSAKKLFIQHLLRAEHNKRGWTSVAFHEIWIFKKGLLVSLFAKVQIIVAIVDTRWNKRVNNHLHLSVRHSNRAIKYRYYTAVQYSCYEK